MGGGEGIKSEEQIINWEWEEMEAFTFTIIVIGAF